MIRPLVVLAVLVASLQDKSGYVRNKADEPTAREFSLRKAEAFSATASRHWRKTYGCVTCHTNGLFLLAGSGAELEATRKFATDYLKRFVVKGEKPLKQKGAIEGLVATASFLAIGGRFDDVTRRSLQHVLARQDEAGGWKDWLQCGWPPFEVDAHFGPSLAAVALGAAPASFRRSKQVAAGVKKLLGWLRANPPSNAHQKGMLLWAAMKLPAVASEKRRREWRRELLALQRGDGGWRLVDLGAAKWKRAKDEVAKLPSDAYATAFAVFVLQQAGVSAKSARLKKGLTWLRRNQRASGRWFVRSPKRDGSHFLSHAATQFAVLALRTAKKR